MAFSIESRVPFLDHRLVEFVFSIADTDKFSNGETKKILRDSMRGILPSGASATSAGTPQNDSRIPATPPASDTSALSASNCRTSRHRLAPSALRSPISFLR